MRAWERAGLRDRIELRLAPAVQTLRALPREATIDLVFIDADKTNYANYYDAGESDGILFIAMRLVEGQDLREILRAKAGLDTGRVLAVKRAPGERVAKGEVLVVLEAMKMEHEVAAPHDGVVRAVPVEPGQQVNAGDVLVILDEQREEASA